MKSRFRPKRKKAWPWLGLLAVSGLFACGPETGGRPEVESAAELAKTQMIEADRAFNAMAQQDGLGPAFAEYMDPEVGFLLQPGSDPVRGREAIFEARDDGQIPAAMTWEPVEAYAATSGDFGFTWGTWRYDPRAPGEDEPIRTGKYVTVWHKSTSGWKGLMDTGVSDPPPERRASPVSDTSPIAPPPANPSQIAPPEIMTHPENPLAEDLPADDQNNQ